MKWRVETALTALEKRCGDGDEPKTLVQGAYTLQECLKRQFARVLRSLRWDKNTRHCHNNSSRHFDDCTCQEIP